MKANLSIASQKGMVLVVGLIFLMILTLIGVSAMNSTALSEKLTQNLRDTTAAFEAAEASMTDGEAWLQVQTAAPTAVVTCTSSPCKVWAANTLGTVYQQPSSWWQSNATNFSSTLYGVAAQPQYIIEFHSFVPYELSPQTLGKGQGYYFYRVNARGTGATSNAQVNLQSIYVTQFN
ncbi:MAG: PilX N-terminal domain-containing pilus assembly protein [Candidatus Berkiella sp.]